MYAHTELDQIETLPGPSGAPLRVLIVEDSPATAAWLSAALTGAGMAVEQVADGGTALARKTWFRPDVALVDLGLPDFDGLSLVERLAQDGDCGVIVVSADASEASRIAGIDIGADDYVVKPPILGELVARIRAVHRRLTRPGHPPATSRPPQVTLDSASRCLVGPGRARTPLTEAEFAAIETLLDADGASVSRDWLGRVALKRPLRADDRSVDQLVLKLRRKIAVHGVIGRTILSSRGLGYVIPEPGRFSILTESAATG